MLAPVQLGKWMILFCDEINLPDMDHYGEKTWSFFRPFSYLREMFKMADLFQSHVDLSNQAHDCQPRYHCQAWLPNVCLCWLPNLCDTCLHEFFFVKIVGSNFSSSHRKKYVKKGICFPFKTWTNELPSLLNDTTGALVNTKQSLPIIDP